MQTGRRGWLMGLVPSVVDAVAEHVEERVLAPLPRRRRPPGAVIEARFLVDALGVAAQEARRPLRRLRGRLPPRRDLPLREDRR